MKVKIKKLNSKAKIPFKTYDSDFCYDVVATSRKKVADNVYEYKLGIALEIERGNLQLGEWEDSPCVLVDKTNYDDAGIHIPASVKNGLYIGPGFYNNLKLSIDFRPRSSIWKTGMILSNCEGTLDEDYRGEIKAYFYKVAPGKIYKVGDKIGQIKLGFTLPIEFEEVDELNNTQRGSDCFGSTGE